MAKIKELKFTIQGKDFKVNLNCSTKGVFSAALPREVSTALGIGTVIESTKIQEVEAAFSDALHRYREAATSMELCIAIRYQACKTYAKDKEGRTMFDSRSPYSLSVSFSDTPAIGFDFRLVIKKTVDGNSSWYDAEEKDEHLTWHQNQQDVSGYVTGSNIYSLRDYKVIPYSPEALATLQKGQETLRQMSEMLFKFISQDEALLEAALTGGKLLN